MLAAMPADDSPRSSGRKNPRPLTKRAAPRTQPIIAPPASQEPLTAVRVPLSTRIHPDVLKAAKIAAIGRSEDLQDLVERAIQKELDRLDR